jgi:hypothetical protein
VKRAGYAQTIATFLESGEDTILGQLVAGSAFAVELTQRDAWTVQIRLLKDVLRPFGGRGSIYLEYSIPRLGKRIDAVAIVDSVIFVIEFKVGDRTFHSYAIDQVYDYALDLKNFHEGSHACYIAPVLVATEATHARPVIETTPHNDRLLRPITSRIATLGDVIDSVIKLVDCPTIDVEAWERARYCPTPTIIEAATALYGGHKVEEISKKDAGAENLALTSSTVDEIIKWSAANSRKSICFVTGVPGAGKTLVGLDVATRHFDKESKLYSVFLSGNGPLVAVLREALARDKVRREKERGESLKIGVARSEVNAFIQNVHFFRDECLVDPNRAPVEHVALFDEAQRAWSLEQTSKFMRQQKGLATFQVSEPEFLISCLNRHPDWAVIVCLVGGGQEINTGEAGISEWLDSLMRSFPSWHLHISSRLTDDEYGAGELVERAKELPNVTIRDELHLSVSMRSFRAENVSLLVKELLDLDQAAASRTLDSLRDRYPIVITRNLKAAKQWLVGKARGNERYGLVVSSHAYRLKPHAIDVRLQVDPVHWFLDGKEDVRSSFYLEDAATEYRVQGLELDWACVTWDADFRYAGDAWEHWSFVGDRWNRIRKPERQSYLKNAYRVLLTRARQGMVIVVPEGDGSDPTRNAAYYDSTYRYLRGIGLEPL